MQRNKFMSYFVGEKCKDGVEVLSCVGDQGCGSAEQMW